MLGRLWPVSVSLADPLPAMSPAMATTETKTMRINRDVFDGLRWGFAMDAMKKCGPEDEVSKIEPVEMLRAKG
jgi:hypothetical protein